MNKTEQQTMKQFLIILVIITLCFRLGTLNSYAQQLPVYSQYLLNDFVLNPAIVGSKDYNSFKSNYRYQWVGIADAPRTFTISVNIPHKPKKVGLGGYIFNDVAGALVRTGINLAYAYHLNVREGLKLSLGMFGGVLQYKVDASKVKLADEEEMYLFENDETAIVPDASFGLYLYSDKYFAGISMNHILHNNLKENLFKQNSESLGQLVNHFFITGGYMFEINDDLDVEPSVMIKVVSPLPVQVDLSARIIYNDEIWLGFSYRTKDALTILLGYEFKEHLYFGFSIDFTTSDLKKYSTGSNEIMLGYRFNKRKKKEQKGLL